jgi:hypothetical protein
MDVIVRRGRRPATGRRTLVRWGALAVGALVVAGAWVWVAREPGASGTAPRPSPPAAHAGAVASKPPTQTTTDGTASGVTGDVTLGVYAGPGQLAAAESLDHRLHGHVAYALDFLADSSWSTITQPAWLVADWRGGPFRMVLAVPMLPASGATLAEGASGRFDAEYTLLAARLVADGLGTAVLMIGCQPDDKGQPWYVGTEATAAAYVRYWDAIRNSMAAVPGAHFVFEWDVGGGGTSPLSPAAMYPGDAAVDVVATDAFDILPKTAPTSTRWQFLLQRRYGPSWVSTFAAAHHKPMAIAMWGEAPLEAGGAGDDPGFVRAFLAWASTAHLRMCVLWDYSSWAVTGGGFPAADAALLRAFAPPASGPTLGAGGS